LLDSIENISISREGYKTYGVHRVILWFGGTIELIYVLWGKVFFFVVKS